MPIETICKKCARKLRVADEFSGRKARCPHCKNVYTVPQALDAESVDPVSPLKTVDHSRQPDSSAEQWRLRTEDGNVYGPVGKTEIDAWLTEGRITVGCHLQRDGSMEWTPAATVYPALTPSTKRTTDATPFAEGSAANAIPHTTPIATTSRRRRLPPHRGGLILTFGVLGIACCNLVSPVAWVMGHLDLNQIREGRMDPTGRGLTQAGMVLGIIGTVLIALQGIFLVVAAFAD